jgi:nucleoside-diphosphate-sugar epimerase
MSSLVTGSSGLLGGCLVQRLRERGEAPRLLDLEPAGEGHPCAAAGPDFVRDDLSDPERVARAASGCEVIYHLAAAQRMKPQFDAWSEAEVFRRNTDAVRCVLAAARRARVRRVVFVSSSGIYGIPRQLPCREDHPTFALGAYGRSKIEAEEICRAALREGQDVAILRPMSLFGPRMSGVFPILFEWVRRGQPVFLLGSGANRVQASSAWDVADACIAAAASPVACGRAYNVASDPAGVPSVLEEVRALVAHAGTRSPVLRIPAFALRGAARALHLVGLSPIVPEHYLLADKDYLLDIDAARRDLGYRPRYDNVRMLIDAYEWYASAGPAWRPAPHPILRLIDRVVPARARIP